MTSLEYIKPFVDADFAIHWLKPRQKAPIGKGWQEAKVASYAELATSYADGNNVGVRLGEFSHVGGGFLHVLDLDIRIASESAAAWEILNELLPEITSEFPTVQSGSGGASRHIYFVTDKPFKSRKIATSGVKFDAAGGKRSWTWEIELFGTGKQVAMPPSIHPDTGKPYTWLREFDFEMLSLGVAPSVPSDAVERAGAKEDVDEPYEGDEDILTELSDDDVRQWLAQLGDHRWDYSHWFQIGMALHHQYRAGKVGLDIWEEISREKPNYKERATSKKWRTFRKEMKRRPVRFASIIKWAQEDIRSSYADDFDDLDVETPAAVDFEDILGGTEDASASGDPFSDFDTKCDDETRTPPSWTDLLDISSKKVIAGTLHNVELIVKNDARLAGLAQINEFTQETVQRVTPGTKRDKRKNAKVDARQLTGRVWEVRDTLNGEIWSQARDYAVRSIIEAPKAQGGYGIKVTDRDLKGAIVLAAWENCFHPVREYLNGLTWDGTARIETLFIDYLGCEDTKYIREVARLMLIAAVARVFEPGCKWDYAIILEGLQGAGKSTFIRTLGRRWFSELEGDFHDAKEMVEKIQGSWIVEMPELSGFSRSDVQSIKSFITRQTDKVRLAYEARATEFPRQNILIGSTNDKEYLRDPTGGRRFLPVECHVDNIDNGKLRSEVDMLWAEARVAYEAMRVALPIADGDLPLYIADLGAAEEAARLQESRRVESADDAVAGQIIAWLSAPLVSGSLDDDTDVGNPRYRKETCLIEMWVECLQNDRKSYNQMTAQMLGRAMRLVPGWKLSAGKTRFKAFGQQRFYVRGNDADRAARLGVLKMD